MVEAFVGQVGGGKSFSSVRRMCNYMARGGRVVTNIMLTGYDPNTEDLKADSPVITFLRDRYRWQYQPRQYQYISFDDMVSLPGWFMRVPGGVDRAHRTFLCIDEATDLFDNLDRGKLAQDSVYRELFRFLRLSRHVHIDVLFICQDLNSINSRLRGLVGFIWKSTDLSNFRMPGFRIALPINSFLLQQFDRTGKLELRREFIAKDRRIFALYQSEAFHDAMGITFSDAVNDGKIKGGKKMTRFQKCALALSFLVAVFGVFRSFSLEKRVSEVLLKIDAIKVLNTQPIDSGHCPESSPAIPVATNVENDMPSRRVVRGVFEFVGTNKGNYCYVDGFKYRPGLLTEYGICKLVSKDVVICVDGNLETVIIPSLPTAAARASEASGGSF